MDRITRVRATNSFVSLGLDLYPGTLLERVRGQPNSALGESFYGHSNHGG